MIRCLKRVIGDGRKGEEMEDKEEVETKGLKQKGKNGYKRYR